jgi:pantoate kinase
LFWRLEDERGIGEVVSQPATLLHVRCKDGRPTQARLILNERNSHILCVCVWYAYMYVCVVCVSV